MGGQWREWQWWQWFGMFQHVGTFLWKWGTHSVRWRPGSPDTRFISPHKKLWVLPGCKDTDMAIDEPAFLLFRAAMNAGPSWPPLSMLAPSWDSPPLSPKVQPSAADQQWEA
ncbi:hypothetical protein BKA82DRAFT_4018659 [Pisolithus tinctorius]|nr:hypothetical protein BKA82DRAFT_4018659 [Pisolithus tinctorius]